MKKIIFIVTILMLTFLVPAVSAQNVSKEQFAKVYSEYRDKYDQYVISHDTYVLSKKQYEQYGTLAAKENLQKDLKNMLVSRDSVLIYYYRSLISKFDDSSISMSSERKSDYTKVFNDEITWLSDHLSGYSVSDSPGTLASKSEEVDDRYQNFQLSVYKSLFYITRGKIDAYNGRYGVLYNDLSALTEKIKNEQRDAYKLSDAKLDTINRWFGEIGANTTEYENALVLADTQMEKAVGKNSPSVYTAAVKLLEKAMTIFTDRIGKTKEIINEIKVSEI